MTGPRRTCLVNNHNYAAFVEEAVASALEQSLPFDEIIVVDDGSTDDSVRRLRERFGAEARVTVVETPNAGQLSAFNEGFVRSRGDLVFFLDSDDAYEPGYVEAVSRVYEDDPACGFVFTALRRFGNAQGVVSPWHRDGDIGCSAVLAMARGKFVGAPTSAVSARREVLAKVLPLPLVEDWRTRADECLVVGCSLAGARKHHLARPLVRYRVHGENRHFGQARDAAESRRFAVRHRRMVAHLAARMGHDPSRWMPLAAKEFATIARPHRRDLIQYLRVVAGARMSLARKLALAASILAHFHRAGAWS